MNRAELEASLSKDFEQSFKRGTPTKHELDLMLYGYFIGRDAAAKVLTQRNSELERFEEQAAGESVVTLRNNLLGVREQIKKLGEANE